MINAVILIGRICHTPELKTTPSGVSVCSFSVAVDRPYKSGEDKQTDFINIVAWRGTAEFIANHFGKGELIGIEGSIQTRKFTDKQGNNRTAFEVVANNVHFIGGKSENATPGKISGNATADDFVDVTDDDSDLPF